MKVTEFGVTVTKKVDIGFGPYMAELSRLGRIFGTRENSYIEVSLWAKAQLGDGEELEVAALELAQRIEKTIDAHLGETGIDASDEMATFKKVEVERPTQEY